MSDWRDGFTERMDRTKKYYSLNPNSTRLDRAQWTFQVMLRAHEALREAGLNRHEMIKDPEVRHYCEQYMADFESLQP